MNVEMNVSNDSTTTNLGAISLIVQVYIYLMTTNPGMNNRVSGLPMFVIYMTIKLRQACEARNTYEVVLA